MFPTFYQKMMNLRLIAFISSVVHIWLRRSQCLLEKTRIKNYHICINSLFSLKASNEIRVCVGFRLQLCSYLNYISRPVYKSVLSIKFFEFKFLYSYKNKSASEYIPIFFFGYAPDAELDQFRSKLKT